MIDKNIIICNIVGKYAILDLKRKAIQDFKPDVVYAGFRTSAIQELMG